MNGEASIATNNVPGNGFSFRHTAALLNLPPGQLRGFLRAGFLAEPPSPSRLTLKSDSARTFTFRDLVLLRMAKGLSDQRVPRRRIQRALERLRLDLPQGQPLTGVSLSADGDGIFVRGGPRPWRPESGQVLFDFEVDELADRVSALPEPAPPRPTEDVEAIYDDALLAEATNVDLAMRLYARVLALAPAHVDAHLNLGRLFHERKLLDAAERHYRLAVSFGPQSATAHFNLGVALEDKGLTHDAVRFYQEALGLDDAFEDAHFNLARLFERANDRTLALRHLMAYRRLVGT